MTRLTNAIPIDAVGCKDDDTNFVALMLCPQPNSPERTGSKGTNGTTAHLDHAHDDSIHEQEHDHQHHGHFFLKFLFLALLRGLMYYCFFNAGNKGNRQYVDLPQTVPAATVPQQ